MTDPRKKKLRVAFHKNRVKRPRSGDLTRHDHESLADLSQDERLNGKGAITRHRTVIGTESASGQAVIDVNLDACQRGRVLWAVGATQCRIQADDGQLYQCTLRRVVRTMSRESRNPLAPGDFVHFQPTTAGEGVIERIEPRRSVLTRGKARFAHLLAANVDQVAIIASVVDPPLKPSLIDRFLISAEKGKARGLICLNKVDQTDPSALQKIAGSYARLGYSVVLTSAMTGAGIPRLRELLKDQATVFTGQSGVGKSSLLNAVQPGLALRVGNVSQDTGKGKHTTRVAELLPLQTGGWVVDTPGVRELALWDVLPEEVEGLFVEFRPLVAGCRFPDCTHSHEIDCAVKQAMASGRISRLRYESYLRITAEESPLGRPNFHQPTAE